MVTTEIPYLRATPDSAQLIVKGQPFLMLPLELHNSSLSSEEYMETVWDNLKDYNFNTVLGSVTWEMIEPEEGKFNFEELDTAILAARRRGLHLVVLWFGSYKNGTSSYVPGWVKTNPSRFQRAKIFDQDGKLKVTEVLSPFCQACWEADAKAFAALMRHIKEFDAAHSTVLMTQVENECGLLGDSRDRCDLANEAFQKPAPTELLVYLKGKKQLHPEFERKWPKFRESVAVDGPVSWTQAFGSSIFGDEIFMTDALSSYVGKVAEAGKKEYSLPFFVNVWMNTEDASLVDLGETGGKIDLPAVAGGGYKPGVYPSGGPCPHTLDFWRYNAPAIDFVSPDIYLQDYEWAAEPNSTFGFYFDPLTDSCKDKWEHTFGKFKLNITRSIAFGEPAPAYGMIIHRGDGRFLFIGQGYQVTFESVDPSTVYTGVLEFFELLVDNDGNLTRSRTLNGDERMSGEIAIMPSETPDNGGFPIRVLVPARTYLAECVAYSI
ncbi:hypothetical protein CDV31_015467 [Fusarium ambrosium]|uniref:Glycoside hydrolase 35 catalytic domain-containing protein n=1 Tax=Fusarium ambrosium TaxID=131363 RepID=A0A428SNR8_9HYPO|nr:hypothetical protein CDV31_015467 [Fusarium ambrosium]